MPHSPPARQKCVDIEELTQSEKRKLEGTHYACWFRPAVFPTAKILFSRHTPSKFKSSQPTHWLPLGSANTTSSLAFFLLHFTTLITTKWKNDILKRRKREAMNLQTKHTYVLSEHMFPCCSKAICSLHKDVLWMHFNISICIY